ncbi:hypothetical protein FD754_005810 [Muntiacus muntjak]|uniref:Uncharacterized protein n=1 Tax=Muntiacus muntjak TaxID=9888 RepID=A0A5N3WJJ8_MUNMU|nr:hypothetical protein FD754_005810 [Muntiacus muntjak]
MSTVHSSVHAKWVMGKVTVTAMQETVEVRVARLFLYFATMLSSTPTLGILSFSKLCLSSKQSPVNHELSKIMFSVGQVIYPMTTKWCGATTYLAGPVFLELTHLTQNLEDLDFSSTW